MADALTVLRVAGRWRARDVRYFAGLWEQLRREVPQFRSDDFKAGDDMPRNPHMRAVVRLPRTSYEHPVPVGVVSNTYTLAQHTEVAEKCFEGIRQAGVEPTNLKCELGMTELGEW